jgi:pyocin large subunit-like protein
MIRRTVSLNPKTDEIVRKVWAELVRRGYSVKYSTVVQLLIMVAAGDASEQAIAQLISEVEAQLKGEG